MNKSSRAQIIATIGPASGNKVTIEKMLSHKMDVARLNMSWGTHDQHHNYIKLIRGTAQESGWNIPIILDLSGPRTQKGEKHELDKKASSITDKDRRDLSFAIAEGVDYVAFSFPRNAGDIKELRRLMKERGKVLPIIAKIERQEALSNIDEIISSSNAIMVARGDLGDNIPFEKVPFAQNTIVKKCKKTGKPAIVATEMMLSMKDQDSPTRAEVSDVSHAILQGADALMLSEETASGKHPVESVAIMEKIILEAEKHLPKDYSINTL